MKVLFIHRSLCVGGVEISLKNNIKLAQKKHKVDLFLCNNLNNIKLDGVNILSNKRLEKFNEYCNKWDNITKKLFKKLNLLNKLKWIKYKILNKLGFIKKKMLKLVSRIDEIKSYYDCVVCYSAYYDVIEIALTKVNALKKIVWIHGDVSATNYFDANVHKYKQFNTICCVSEACKNAFINKYHDIKNVEYCYNPVDKSKILSMAKEECTLQGSCGGPAIICVARLSEEKAHIRFLEQLKKLREQEYEFSYHIVGDGPMKQHISEFVNKNNMGNYVFMYGNQSNPYKFIKKSDLLVLHSYHEAAPMVFDEAFTLGVPALSTNTVSAKEIVGDFGFVCENTSEDICNSLKKIFENADLIKQKRENVKENYSKKGKNIDINYILGI